MCTYYGNIASFDSSSFALAPLFKDANVYLDGDDEEDVELINALVREGTGTIGSNDLVSPAIMEVRATASIDTIWKPLATPRRDDRNSTPTKM